MGTVSHCQPAKEFVGLTFTKVDDVLPVEMIPQRRTCGCGVVAMVGLCRLQREDMYVQVRA